MLGVQLSAWPVSDGGPGARCDGGGPVKDAGGAQTMTDMEYRVKRVLRAMADPDPVNRDQEFALLCDEMGVKRLKINLVFPVACIEIKTDLFQSFGVPPRLLGGDS
jgi:hypothetical protein